MSGIFRDTIRVRAYERDSLGHVNNAVFINYLTQATLDAHGVGAETELRWRLQACAIEFHTPALYGDTLEVTTWVTQAYGNVVTREYLVTRPSDGHTVVGARLSWYLTHTATGIPCPLPDSYQVPVARDLASPLKPFVYPSDNNAAPFFWHQRVRRYELDASRRVAPTAYLNWLEEATMRASTVAGWSIAQMWLNDLVILQFRHDAEFFVDASLGDEIEIVSRLIDIKRVRGVWVHEIYRTEPRTLLMRDYSTGVFLDRAGHIRAGIPKMGVDLQRGEPTENP